jgi:hypothetical protein
MLQLASLVWTVSFVVFRATGPLPPDARIPALLLAILIFTAAEMIQGPALNDLAVAIAPEAARGRYLGAYQLSWGAGTALAPALFSWLFTISAGLWLTPPVTFETGANLTLGAPLDTQSSLRDGTGCRRAQSIGKELISDVV